MSGGQRTEDIRWWCTNYKHVAGPFSSGFSLGLGLGRHPRCPLPLPWLIIISSFSPKTKFVCRVSAYFDLWFDLHLTGRDCSSSIWVIMMNCCRDHVKFDQPGWPGDHWPPALSKHSDTNNDDGSAAFCSHFDQDANNCLEFMKCFLSPEFWPDRCASKYNCWHLGCTYNCFKLKSHISYSLDSKFILFLEPPFSVPIRWNKHLMHMPDEIRKLWRKPVLGTQRFPEFDCASKGFLTHF